MAGATNTFSTQTSIAAPGREAGCLYCLRAKEPIPSASGVEGSSCKLTPHPAYGSELATGGGRLVRAFSAMEPARRPSPVSSTARTIDEQKAKVKAFSKLGGRPISGKANRELTQMLYTPYIFAERTILQTNGVPDAWPLWKGLSI